MGASAVRCWTADGSLPSAAVDPLALGGPNHRCRRRRPTRPPHLPSGGSSLPGRTRSTATVARQQGQRHELSGSSADRQYVCEEQGTEEAPRRQAARPAVAAGSCLRLLLAIPVRPTLPGFQQAACVQGVATGQPEAGGCHRLEANGAGVALHGSQTACTDYSGLKNAQKRPWVALACRPRQPLR